MNPRNSVTPQTRPSRSRAQPSGHCADHQRTHCPRGDHSTYRGAATANVMPCSSPHTPQAPRMPRPTCAYTPTRIPPSTLRNVMLADLGDVARLLALHQQAIARGWLKGGEAAQLNVVAAAVHARRVGETPCRLFVALLRDQWWEVITQEDEDQARRLLREHRDGPAPRTRAPATVPEVSLSDDARFVLRARAGAAPGRVARRAVPGGEARRSDVDTRTLGAARRLRSRSGSSSRGEPASSGAG